MKKHRQDNLSARAPCLTHLHSVLPCCALALLCAALLAPALLCAALLCAALLPPALLCPAWPCCVQPCAAVTRVMEGCADLMQEAGQDPIECVLPCRLMSAS